MKSAQLLPKETIWRSDGHASDLAISAVADGQLDVVPALALAHVERCNLCGDRLGDAVALSLQVDAVVAEHRRAPALAPAGAPVPLPAFAGALLLALSGVIMATGGLGNLRAGFVELVRLLFVLVRAVLDVTPLAVRAMGDAAVIATSVSGLLVVLMGWSVAHLTPRQAWKGSVG